MNASTVPQRAAVDAPSAIVSACYLTAITSLVINIQPMILGGVARTYDLSDAAVGQMGSIYVGATTLVSLTAPLWVRRVDWRVVALLSLAAATACLMVGATLMTAASMLTFFAVLGVFKSLAGAPVFASLGDANNPDRGFALSVLFQSAMAAVAAWPLSSLVVPRFGMAGLFIGLAIIMGTGLIAALWLPRRGTIVESKDDTPVADRTKLFSLAAIPAWMALVAAALFVAGVLGFWYFIERIGSSRGLSESTIGLTLSSCAIASIISTAIAAWLGGRLPTFVFTVGGTTIILLAYATLQGPGAVMFVLANVLFSLGWGLAQPSFWGVLRKVDASNRLFVAAPAAGGIGGVMGGLLAGPVIALGGYPGIIFFSGCLLVTAALMAGGALHVARRISRPALAAA